MRSRMGRTVQAVGVHLNGNGEPARHRADAVRCGMRAIVASLLLAGGGVAVSAREPAAPDGLTLDNASNGWVVAPDFKFTRVDDSDAALVGAYGGKFIERRLLVGGGAYWLSGAPDVSMAYGGGLVEWFGNPGGLVDFSVRGFVGLGTATLSERFGFSDGCGDFSVSNFDMPGPGDIKGGCRSEQCSHAGLERCWTRLRAADPGPTDASDPSPSGTSGGQVTLSARPSGFARTSSLPSHRPRSI